MAGAGITSALEDFCYKTTTVVPPSFMAVLGLPAAVLGTVEGVADAVASFSKMISGYIADRLGHCKLLVLVGYSLTLSWFGKGLRGPLRDAIVVQAMSPETHGRAFGFHRATDTLWAHWRIASALYRF